MKEDSLIGNLGFLKENPFKNGTIQNNTILYTTCKRRILRVGHGTLDFTL